MYLQSLHQLCCFPPAVPDYGFIKGWGGSFITLSDDCLISFIRWSRPSHQVIDCCVSSSQTLTECLALANSYRCLRIFCLFIKAGWPVVSSYLFCQAFSVCEYLVWCTFWSCLLHIHSGMKLAYYTILILLCRQTRQETIVNWHQCFWFGETLGSALCRWKLLPRHEGLVSPSLSLNRSSRIRGRRWSLSHVSCRVDLQWS